MFTTVRCSGVEILNADGTVPPAGSLLAFGDKGKVEPTQQITVQEIDLSGGVLTYDDVSGLLVNGKSVDCTFSPQNIRYFNFYNQTNLDPPIAELGWPPGLWSDVSGPISTAEWVCSVVGSEYNYTGQPQDVSSAQYSAICYPASSGTWYIKRQMPPYTGIMGFQIMAMRSTVCNDGRHVVPLPVYLAIDPSGDGFAVSWGWDTIGAYYPFLSSVELDWYTGTRTVSPPVITSVRNGYAITGLEPLTEYTVSARFCDENGVYGQTKTVVGQTNKTPITPTIYLQNIGVGNADIRWQTDLSYNNIEIELYDGTSASGAPIATGTTTMQYDRFLIPDQFQSGISLQEKTYYTVRIRFTSVSQLSNWATLTFLSATTDLTFIPTPYRLPIPNLQAHSLDVEWDLLPGYPQIQSISLECGIPNEQTGQSGPYSISAEQPFTFSSLRSETTYECSLRYQYQYNYGEAYTIQVTTPASLDTPAVSFDAVASSSTTIDVEWSTPFPPGSRIIFYRISGVGRYTELVPSNDTVSSYQISGLTPDTLYDVVVASKSGSDYGPFNPQQVRTFD